MKRLVIALSVSSIAAAGLAWALRPGDLPPVIPPTEVVPEVAATATSRLESRSIEVWDRHVARLQQADRESIEAGRRAQERVAAFFNGRKESGRPFADDVLGIWGKISVAGKIVDDVQGAFVEALGGGSQKPSRRFADYLRQHFRETVVSESQVKKAIDEAMDAFDADVDAIEAQLFVDLEADLGDDVKKLTEAARTGRVEAECDAETVITYAIEACENDFALSIGTGVFSLATSSLLGMPLGTEGLSGFATQTAVGFGVDYGIEKGIAATGYDPASRIDEGVRLALDKLCEKVVQGDPSLVAYHAELQFMAHGHPDPEVRRLCLTAKTAIEQKCRLGMAIRLFMRASERSRWRCLILYRHLFGPDASPPLAMRGGHLDPAKLPPREQIVDHANQILLEINGEHK